MSSMEHPQGLGLPGHLSTRKKLPGGSSSPGTSTGGRARCAHLLSESFQCLRGNPGTDKQLLLPASAFTNRNLESIFNPKTPTARGGEAAAGPGAGWHRGDRRVALPALLWSPSWLLVPLRGVTRRWQCRIFSQSESRVRFAVPSAGTVPHTGCAKPNGSDFSFPSTTPKPVPGQAKAALNSSVPSLPRDDT